MIAENILWAPGTTLEQIEAQVIQKAFAHYKGNKTATAKSLDIAIRTLESKLEKFELDGTKEKEAQHARQETREQFLARQRGFSTDSNGNIIPYGANPLPKAPAPRSQQNGEGAEAGLQVQPSSIHSAQQSVSLSERQKIQALPSKQTAPGGRR